MTQAVITNLRTERELERKLKELEDEEERQLKDLTLRKHKLEQESLKLQAKSHVRPRHGDNRWKRERALASLPSSPVSRRTNWRSTTSTESSGSSQEDYSGLPPLTSSLATPIPTILITDTERGVVSPQTRQGSNTIPLLAHRDYMNRITMLSGSSPSLFTCNRPELKQGSKLCSSSSEIFKLPPIVTAAPMTSSKNCTSSSQHTHK